MVQPKFTVTVTGADGVPIFYGGCESLIVHSRLEMPTIVALVAEELMPDELSGPPRRLSQAIGR